MRLISHRGNLTGANPELENSVPYIEAALKKDFDVEIDIWMREDQLYLGHDEPQYEIDFDFLFENKNKLWIHCKNIEVFSHLAWTYNTLNFFWHQTDDYTLTSSGWIWAYPGKMVSKPSKAIAVMPEHYGIVISKFAGVCSDYIETYANDKTDSVRP